jgi:NAD(P)H-dependent FMN reductase
MLTVISGTNRPESNTLKVATIVQKMLAEHGNDVALLDLATLPTELFSSSSYSSKPDSFAPFQETILEADGFLTVVPEYNGSFPGVVKYFIDMLRFPESLYEKPAAFVGIAAGRWAGVRAVEHLEMVFQYRHAHLFGRRCFIPHISRNLSEKGDLTDPALAERLEQMVSDFAVFCATLRGSEE